MWFQVYHEVELSECEFQDEQLDPALDKQNAAFVVMCILEGL